MKKSLGPKTLIYPTPVLVVGTYDKDGKPNVMTASWGGICCSQPPCIAVSLRKATQSYLNIKERKAFTISIPSADYVKQADYFGLVSGRNTNKFAVTKLSPKKSTIVDAPFVKEFPVVLECQLVHVFELGVHTQFIGEVLDAKVEEAVMGAGASVEIKKVNPLVFVPDTQEYYSIGDFVGKVFSVGQGI
jgi:flavin reductase (DIM6/NTAB) family NADH-FMN oxidoreductase RutF